MCVCKYVCTYVCIHTYVHTSICTVYMYINSQYPPTVRIKEVRWYKSQPLWKTSLTQWQVINIWSYLEEVQTDDFVVVCVQVIEGLCREQQQFKHQATVKPTHRVQTTRAQSEGDDTHCTWSPVWPGTWQSCQSQHSCRPRCNAGWSTGTGCWSAWSLEAGTKNQTHLIRLTCRGFSATQTVKPGLPADSRAILIS